ncbi:YbaB/EbfC family nucleoid-associated protein [Paradevosia shaoguanensis]|uniref:Nucleoid-associated protein ML536_02175 n=1 Tax=Paradevosia shaoguanensis TaxID=1335043 RepID=A0AA41QIM4_9HYPH|nr:YbaB/EbfC family nucleoid-associated protein [Paradevosia shaoguanensis]KFL25634.1 nucleoid-associated protein [Devosia sp. 17-2-E-8]MCF1741142.1 YbaB/EbfC family nucleoid-associated protein [Paradevosia shaoguanensis]MCI0125625.1 YbaB/EbfC family nucleoid-associated protein [Paradevosia shaoguanensis]QMV03442.1 YbaB/EbfC family nucleoid-associated protein [Devosia sp. D6-9]
MADFLNMMKKAQEMQAKMQQMQAELGNLVVEGQSGGGLVKVSLSGKGELKGLKIDPSLIKPEDAEMIEDLIIAAHADAKSKAEVEMNSRMQEVTAGLPLPPGMKFPF